MESFDVQIVKSLLLVLTIGLWLNWLWTRRHLYRFIYNFPGPRSLPLIGVLHTFQNPDDILTALTKIFKRIHKDAFCAWVGIDPWFATQDPEMAKNILSSPDLLNKATIMYSSFNEFLKGGLITSPDVEWQHHRKLINPSFNHKVLVNFFPIFHKAKVLTLSKFDALVGKGENKLEDMLQRIAVGISIETTMGKEMKEEDEANVNIARKFQIIKKAIVVRTTLVVVRLQGLFHFYSQFNKSSKYIHDFVDELLRNKLKKLNESEQNSDQPAMQIKGTEGDEFSIKKKPTIFIDQAIQFYRKQQFNWHNISSESVTIVAGSFDTTANGVFSNLVMLAMHPDVQEKLYEEIVSVFPDKDFVMEFEDIEKLTYLDMVIKETLRIAPSIPLIGRQVVKDTQLNKDILLPKGMMLMISIFNLHHNTNVWGPNADKFNPDNFLPQNIQEKHSHAFIPFSKGARNCIGWRYAMFAMKVILAGCVRNFKFTTTFKYEDLKFLESIVLEYEIEPEIEIHRRE